MFDITDLRSTIVPKSDQLNAEQLLGGPMTITVTDVRTGTGEDQPVSIHYEDDNGRPFKPCKTMRKVLILAWGHDARRWIGQSMVLFNDASVKFGGMDVGGIRISHMTGIPKDIHVSLTATKGKKAPHAIKRLDTGPDLSEVLKAIAAASNKATMDAAKGLASQLVIKTDIDQAMGAYKARVAALRATSAAPKTGAPDTAAMIAAIEKCADLVTLQLHSDEAESLPAGAGRDAVMAALLKRDGELAGIA
ncbi:MAG: hypothetical protein KA795_20410 [Burkholderiaceae bacterium]|jgi:hypothetical protein|nr:hypothetical protein [Burkholderiaceae bacterium]MBP7668763.1 hypothetical protein [Burkholderiaceae bacterium]